MEQPPVDPLVNKAVERLAEHLGHPIRCPFCRSEEWGLFNNGISRLWLGRELAESEEPAEDEPLTIRVLAFGCPRCFYIWFHVVSETFGSE